MLNPVKHYIAREFTFFKGNHFFEHIAVYTYKVLLLFSDY